MLPRPRQGSPKRVCLRHANASQGSQSPRSPQRRNTRSARTLGSDPIDRRSSQTLSRRARTPGACAHGCFARHRFGKVARIAWICTKSGKVRQTPSFRKSGSVGRSRCGGVMGPGGIPLSESGIPAHFGLCFRLKLTVLQAQRRESGLVRGITYNHDPQLVQRKQASNSLNAATTGVKSVLPKLAHSL